jgi:hypothetical protein
LVLLAWVALLGLAAAHRQDIWDWWKLHSYQPSAAVEQLAAQDTMTDYGRHVFYVNQPAITANGSFRAACPNDGGEQTIVLGCYHSNQNGIYLLNVTDNRLKGVEEVTAAHEMLHAAYDRLSGAERARVDKMLQDYYDNGLTDQRIRKTIEAYKSTEPKDLVNEMHSIFGTEVANLPAPLEQYYQKYFSDRGQIAAYAAQYQAEFTSRQSAIASDDAQLAQLKSQIDGLEADLKAKQAGITAAQANLSSLRGSNPAAYNAAVPGYNAQVDAYNAEIAQVRDLISRYNALVAERNAIALEEDELVQDLSNQPAPINN